MTDDEFKLHVEALALTKLEQPKKMSKQCDIYWNEISSHQYHFDRGCWKNFGFFVISFFEINILFFLNEINK